MKLSPNGVAVVCGTDAQLGALNTILQRASRNAENEGQVLVIGGSKVGQAVLRTLRANGLRATVIESDPRTRLAWHELADRGVVGTATDLEIVKGAGLEQS